jgi:CheY-like chemotaxis protein
VARILCVAPELLFAAKLESTLSAAGHEVTVVADPPLDLGPADLIIADLMAVDPAAVAGRGLPALGFYRHTEPEVKERADAAGFDLVVPRSRMAREMVGLVERLLAGGEAA